MVTWDHVTRAEILPAIEDYDRLGPDYPGNPFPQWSRRQECVVLGSQ